MPNKEKAMKQITLAIFVMVLGSFVIVDAAGADGGEWKVVTVELAPGAVSAVHHHGESESAIYVISGSARFWSGADLSRSHDADAGDFVWVPPHEVHVEANRSDTEPVRMAVARSTQKAIVVNLPNPEGWPAKT